MYFSAKCVLFGMIASGSAIMKNFNCVLRSESFLLHILFAKLGRENRMFEREL